MPIPPASSSKPPGPLNSKSDRAYNPDRLFFDIPHARPWIDQSPADAPARSATNWSGASGLPRSAPGTTRIVFDLTERRPISRSAGSIRRIAWSIEFAAARSTRRGRGDLQALLCDTRNPSASRPAFVYPPRSGRAHRSFSRVRRRRRSTRLRRHRIRSVRDSSSVGCARDAPHTAHRSHRAQSTAVLPASRPPQTRMPFPWHRRTHRAP